MARLFPPFPRARLAGVLLVAGLLAVVDVACALGETSGIAVITGASTPVKSLTREQVADIFLGRMPPGENWKLIDSSEEQLRQRFYLSAANLTANRARAIWARLVFASRATPPREMSPEKAAAAVLGEPFGITYVDQAKVPANGKVLLILP